MTKLYILTTGLLCTLLGYTVDHVMYIETLTCLLMQAINTAAMVVYHEE